MSCFLTESQALRPSRADLIIANMTAIEVTFSLHITNSSSSLCPPLWKHVKAYLVYLSEPLVASLELK